MRHKLGDFLPIWQPGSEQRWTSTKRKRNSSITASPSLRDLWRWTARHPPDGEGPLIPHGRRFQDLYDHLLDLDDEEAWHFRRPLGKGTFGAAAQFQKIGEDGKILDDVVVKSARAEIHLMVQINGGLSIEAAVMSQLYELDNNFLLALRNYKYLDTQPQLRYYLEHCEYGDLNRLHMRYKAWQMRFPELFLWHVFRCLAVSIGGQSSLASGPFRSLHAATFGDAQPGAFLHHKDIKLENTFFGEPIGHTGYGRVCLADFGISTILTERGSENKAFLQEGGTASWMSPECRVNDMCKRFFVKPFVPPRQYHVSSRTVVGSHRLTPSVNIWPVGAMIWTLVTGHDITVLDRVVCNIFDRAYWPYEPHTILPIRTNGEPQYSTELLELVRDCLKLDPSTRPSPDELRNRTEAGYERLMQIEMHRHAMFPELTEQRLKVYCKANEIQSQPVGNANYDLSGGFWERFIEDQIWLPEEWGPLWPPSAPENREAHEHWPYLIRKRFYDMKEVARRQDVADGSVLERNIAINF